MVIFFIWILLNFGEHLQKYKKQKGIATNFLFGINTFCFVPVGVATGFAMISFKKHKQEHRQQKPCM